MATSITEADLKASGETAAGPLFSRQKEILAGSSFEKDGDKAHSTSGFDELSGLDYGAHLPPANTATFQGDEAFYPPIEQYEGKHRYDPEFQWEPQEEKKLVRKV